MKIILLGNAHLERLIDWVRSYETRDAEYGLLRHRTLFDEFVGRKRELTHPDQDGAV